ncbi:MAG TPA: HIT domain-containing protein [Acidimicrobiales bacterium]|nr:HIT domain-containing protein [Acidimicrobiales bacterium]
MPLERLWAGWRGDYITSPQDTGGCVLCRVLEASDDEGNVVWRGKFTAAILNAYPYTSGHVMVLPLRHAGEPEGLAGEESTELWQALTRAIRAVKGAYGPDGLNVGANLGKIAGAGVPGHFHLHVLPRWEGDTNFMTTVAEARVLPEPLSTTLAKLRAAWPS